MLRKYVLAFTTLLNFVPACGADPKHDQPAPESDGGAAPGRDAGVVDSGKAPAPGATDDVLKASVQSASGLTIELVTLRCAGDCADVLAVASGGHAPYAFSWEDGSTSPARTVCPNVDTVYRVSVSDTASGTGEFRRPAQTASAPLTASVLACSTSDADWSGTVPGSADIFLAGQPDGASLPRPPYSYGPLDTVPANSPVEVPVSGGSTLTFSVTGATSVLSALGLGCTAPSPDGGCGVGDVSTGDGGRDSNGLSLLQCPADALVGVFTDAAVPAGTPPQVLDVQGANDFVSLYPQLRQVFFIGDGLTGTGDGAAQQFVAPAGATRLFLASSDGMGLNSDNTGEFSVRITVR